MKIAYSGNKNWNIDMLLYLCIEDCFLNSDWWLTLPSAFFDCILKSPLLDCFLNGRFSLITSVLFVCMSIFCPLLPYCCSSFVLNGIDSGCFSLCWCWLYLTILQRCNDGICFLFCLFGCWLWFVRVLVSGVACLVLFVWLLIWFIWFCFQILVTFQVSFVLV